MKKILILIIALIPLMGGCVKEDEAIWSLQPGDALPQFSVQVEGKTVTTESLRGKKSVIVFFDTNCKDCRAALPQIQAAYDEALKTDEAVTYLCISREEPSWEIQQYWQENNLTLPFSAQTDRKVYNLFASSIIPRIYVSNANLIIEKVYE